MLNTFHNLFIVPATRTLKNIGQVATKPDINVVMYRYTLQLRFWRF
jgi:hypothetical protein